VSSRGRRCHERLLEVAGRYKGEAGQKRVEDTAWRSWPVAKRLEHALVKASTSSW